MNLSAWATVRFLHVLSAVLWVGGQLTLSLIVRPAAVRALDAEQRSDLFTLAGTRFARLSTLLLIPVLLGSGLALAWHRGVDFGMLTLPGYGLTLGIKITLALVSLALAIRPDSGVQRSNRTEHSRADGGHSQKRAILRENRVIWAGGLVGALSLPNRRWSCLLQSVGLLVWVEGTD